MRQKRLFSASFASRAYTLLYIRTRDRPHRPACLWDRRGRCGRQAQIEEHACSQQHQQCHGQHAPHEIAVEATYVSMSHLPNILLYSSLFFNISTALFTSRSLPTMRLMAPFCMQASSTISLSKSLFTRSRKCYRSAATPFENTSCRASNCACASSA